MKSLTLHALDDQLAAQIQRRATEEDLSMNELAKRLLAEGLGIKAPSATRHRQEFAGFCGIWKKEDARDFAARTGDMGAVNPEDWR